MIFSHAIAASANASQLHIDGGGAKVDDMNANTRRRENGMES